MAHLDNLGVCWDEIDHHIENILILYLHCKIYYSTVQ